MKVAAALTVSLAFAVAAIGPAEARVAGHSKQPVPVNTSAPTVSGTAALGSTLNGSAGSWQYASSYSYAWRQCDSSGGGCSTIRKATSLSYSPVSADLGHTLRLAVTAKSSGGSATAVSAPTAPVSGQSVAVAAPQNLSAPTISGTAQVGSTLSASPGSWSTAASYAYQWTRCDTSGQACASVSGATSAAYLLASGDAGSTFRVVVTASNSGGATSATSAATATVAGPPAPQSLTLPSISGSAQVGSTLTASPGTWSWASAYGYQWQRCDAFGSSCANLLGASATTYVVALADAGSTLRVVVTASGGGGTSSIASSPTATVTTTSTVPTTPDGLWRTDIAPAWFTPIPASPVISPLSGTIVSAQQQTGFYLALNSYSAPRYYASSSDPYRTVRVVDSNSPYYGKSFSIRIPAAAAPAPGTDGHMEVVDQAAGTMSDFYQAVKQSDGSWNAGYFYQASLPSPGVITDVPRAGTRAAGVMNTLGCLTKAELDGTTPITHALAFSAAHQGSKYLKPVAGGAMLTGGTDSSTAAVDDGTRWQLNPGYDASALDATQQRIARALQTYGMIMVDGSGSNMGLFGCAPVGTYTSGVGLNIPVSQFRVLDFTGVVSP